MVRDRFLGSSTKRWIDFSTLHYITLHYITVDAAVYGNWECFTVSFSVAEDKL